MAMCIGQLSGRASLRDLIMNPAAQSSKLYHLGIERCSRATLARVNEQQPASLYEAIFHKLLQQCRQFAPRHRFKFNGKLYLLDATVIDLCLSVFPWATFCTWGWMAMAICPNSLTSQTAKAMRANGPKP